MKRRGVLGLLAGAAVAGPAMAKEAVGLAATQIGSSMGTAAFAGTTGFDTYPSGINPLGPDKGWAASSLARLLGRTAETIAAEKRQMRVHQLDPDLASYRSMSLSAKIRMQKDRDYERNVQDEKSHLEKVISGFFDD